ALVNAAGVLERAESTGLDATRAKVIISRQLQHLAHLVNHLLDVSRVVFGRIHLTRHPMDLAELVEGGVDSLRTRGATADHQITVEGQPVWIEADTKGIEEIVMNLVENAIKFTPAGGLIAITVRREAADAVLTVQDTGVGISAEALPR